jgi:HEAT repeat protein
MTAGTPRFGVFTTDTALTIRTWDPSLAAMTGVSAERATGRPLREVIPDLDARDLTPRFERVLATGVVEVLTPAFHGHLIACPPLTPSRHFETMRQRATIAPLRDERSSIVGIIVTVEDLTMRLDRERDLAAGLKSHDATVRIAAIEAIDAAGTADLTPLTGALGDRDWRVRRAAAGSLARSGDSDVVNSVLTMLRDAHRDFSVLSSALHVLAMSNIDIVGPLIELLETGEVDLRTQAALLLGRQRDARVVPALIGALGDADANVRFHAVEALGHLRSSDAVDPLLALALSGDFFLAYPALDALARIGDRRVAPDLVPLLANEVLRNPSAEALGQLGDEATVLPLVRLLDQPDAPVDIVADALAQIHRRYEDEFGDAQHIAADVARAISPLATRKLIDAAGEGRAASLPALARVLGWLDGPAVHKAVALMLGHQKARAEVVKALVRYGSDVVDLLAQQLGSDDPETRHAAVVALGRIGDRRSTTRLVEAMQKDDTLVLPVATALARIGDAAAYEPLVALIGHPEPASRHAVVAALNSIGHPDMAQRMATLLRHRDINVRESAVRIAGYFGYPQCVEGLLACCRDEDESIRRVALEHLPFVEGHPVIDVLAAALARDTPRARAGAAQALGRVEGAEADRLLIGALADRDPWVRFFSVRALGQRRLTAAAQPLTAMTANDPAYHVRLSAVEALGRIGTPEAVRCLAALVEGKDRELAHSALRAFGLTNTPDVVPVLEAALRHDDPEDRAAAAEAIAARDGAGAIDALRWTAAADPIASVWETAVDGLATLASRRTAGSAGAIEALLAVSVDPGRREACVRALASVPASEIDRVGAGLESPRVDARCAVVAALGRIRHPRASHWLRTALDDTAPTVRSAAAAALGRLGSRGAERDLARLARVDPDAGVRRAAAAALHPPRLSGDDAPGAAPARQA